jgi:hypothetical protein
VAGRSTRSLYVVRDIVAMFAGGAVCLPLTYRISRSGPMEWSAVIVAVVSLVTAIYVARFSVRPLWKLLGAFVAGALASEALFLAYWTANLGKWDDLSFAVAAVEFVAIATLGTVVAAVVCVATRRITTRSSGP